MNKKLLQKISESIGHMFHMCRQWHAGSSELTQPCLSNNWQQFAKHYYQQADYLVIVVIRVIAKTDNIMSE